MNNNLLSKSVLMEIRKIASLYADILAVYLFGSSAKGTDNKKSDIDIAIVVSDRSKCDEFDLLPHFSKIAFPKEFDLTVVDRNSSPLLLFQIIKNGKYIYKKDIHLSTAFESEVMRYYYDTQHMRNIYKHYLSKAFKQNTYGR